VMHEEVLTGDLLARQVLNLIENPARLKTMSECSLALGRPDAAERVVAACRELVGRA
jgi:UDP-N-acetylglucosamine:LPS N-acetylglucosamine transferase